MTYENTHPYENDLIESAKSLGLDNLIEIIERLDAELTQAIDEAESLSNELTDVKSELAQVKEELALYEEEDE